MTFITPTEEELEAVAEVKEQLLPAAESHPNGDFSAQISELSPLTCLRFYRGRKKIMQDVLNSLTNHLQWRKENDVSNFEEFDISNEVTSKKSYISEKDLAGHPVIYVFARRHNKNNRDIEEIKRFIIYLLNKALQDSNPSEEQIVIVFDLTNFGLSCMDYEAVQVLIAILAHNYPEILATVHIVNHPWLFNACWAIIRPWIDPVTAEKVNFTSVEELPNFIDKENIPSDVGNYDN